MASNALVEHLFINTTGSKSYAQHAFDMVITNLVLGNSFGVFCLHSFASIKMINIFVMLFKKMGLKIGRAHV